MNFTFWKKLKALILFNFIFQIICRNRWKFLAQFLVISYLSVHVSLQPYVVKLIIEALSINPVFSNIIIPILCYISLELLFNFISRIYDYLCLQLYPTIKTEVIAYATEIVSHHEHAFFQNEFSGSIANKIKELSRGVNDTLKILFDRFFHFFLTLIIASYTLMQIHPLLSFTLIIYTLFVIIISVFFNKNIRVYSRTFSEANSQVTGAIVDRFINILSIKLFRTYVNEAKELDMNLKIAKRKEKVLRWYILKVIFLQGIMTTFMIGVSLLILSFSAQDHSISVGDFALVLTLSISITNIILSFSQDISYFSECFGQVSQGVSLLERKRKAQDISNAKNLLVTRGKIEFSQVYFSHISGMPLFNNQSIVIPGGQKVGLVGYSGNGKSTFLNLILRLFDLDSGEILIDGQDISLISQESLHRAITVIPQEATLFHRSILENIRYGCLNASDEEITQAAKKAAAHEFIMSLPSGYSTLVGERGIKLSGGERQRIAIARAFLKGSPILLLDEATSALDSVTEGLIKESLSTLMKGKTVIAIAHRLSTLFKMDRILVIDQGKVVEDGTFKKLFQSNGIFHKLCSTQVLA